MPAATATPAPPVLRLTGAPVTQPESPTGCHSPGAADEPLGEAGPDWRLVVAPTSGTFVATAPVPTDGAGVRAGDALGHVRARRDETAVASPWSGVLVEWLVVDGDPVAAGQPLARVADRSAA